MVRENTLKGGGGEGEKRVLCTEKFQCIKLSFRSCEFKMMDFLCTLRDQEQDGCLGVGEKGGGGVVLKKGRSARRGTIDADPAELYS